MGNVESVSEKLKNFGFFWHKLAGKLILAKKDYSTPLKWIALHRLMQKNKHFEAYCEDRTKNVTFAL